MEEERSHSGRENESGQFYMQGGKTDGEGNGQRRIDPMWAGAKEGGFCLEKGEQSYGKTDSSQSELNYSGLGEYRSTGKRDLEIMVDDDDDTIQSL